MQPCASDSTHLGDGVHEVCMRGRSYEQRSSSYKRKVLFDSRLVTPIQISDLHPPGKLRRDRRGSDPGARSVTVGLLFQGEWQGRR
jgi:hypothetical protein